MKNLIATFALVATLTVGLTSFATPAKATKKSNNKVALSTRTADTGGRGLTTGVRPW